MNAVSEWQNFYVIVGSSAGALIGLQFVVITLLAEMPLTRDVERASSAFATPTIVHFVTVLFLSAVLSSPWHSITPAAVTWGIVGIVGLVYAAIIGKRMRVQTAYAPVFEDWLFHFLLPLAAYATLMVTAFMSGSHIDGSLFGVAGAALLLLFVGIHNAWDTVTYFLFVHKGKQDQGEQK